MARSTWKNVQRLNDWQRVVLWAGATRRFLSVEPNDRAYASRMLGLPAYRVMVEGIDGRKFDAWQQVLSLARRNLLRAYHHGDRLYLAAGMVPTNGRALQWNTARRG